MIFDLLHVRIRTKLLGLVLLPVVGGGVLSGLVVAEQIRLLERMHRLRAASNLSISVGNLAHALQVEAGSTALHLGIRGAQNQDEMLRARAATDRERLALDAALSDTEVVFRPLVPAPVREGQRLKELRRRADRQGGTPELIDGYGREVEALVHVQEDLMTPAAGTPVEGRYKAFAVLVRAKEAAGYEAAMLANACSMGVLDGGSLERIQAYRDTQKAQGEAFQALAPEGLRQDYRDSLAGPFAAELQQMRSTLKPGRLEQDAEGWVRAATAELEAFKGVQDRMSQGLLLEARSLERGARTKSWSLAAGFGLFGLAVLLWTWRATMLITEPLRALADGMARLQQGDLRTQLPVQTYDETGRMTEAFNTMSAHLRALAQALQGHAAQVSNSAHGLAGSAEQVSSATQQLGKSSRVQRLASDGVVQAVTDLQASALGVKSGLDDILENGQAAGREIQNATRRARALVAFFQALIDRSDPSLHRALREGETQMSAILQTMAQVEETLAVFEAVAGDIQRASEEQARISGEVSLRMAASQEATTEVQRAAAQLANTAPEVVLTSRDLVLVAESLSLSAAVFRVD